MASRGSVWVPAESIPNAVPGTGPLCGVFILGMIVTGVIQWIYNAITGGNADFMGYGFTISIILGILAVMFGPDN